jgi:hypothetical protein
LKAIHHLQDSDHENLGLRIDKTLSIDESNEHMTSTFDMPMYRDRRSIAMAFLTDDGSIRYIVISFIIRDITMSFDIICKNCVCISEVYTQKHDNEIQHILAKVYECLVLASTISNSYLTFYLPDELYSRCRLNDVITDIRSRSLTPLYMLSAHPRPIYMARLTRFYFPILLDRPYLHELSSILGATPHIIKTLNQTSDLVLSLACCGTFTERINKEDPVMKQFTYATSLACVFAEDVEFIVKSSPLFLLHHSVLESDIVKDELVNSITLLVSLLHETNENVAPFKMHSKPPISFEHHLFGNDDIHIHQKIQNYHRVVCEDELNKIDVKISNYPNETIDMFYLLTSTSQHAITNANTDVQMDDVVQPESNLYHAIPSQTIYALYDEDKFESCKCSKNLQRDGDAPM